MAFYKNKKEEGERRKEKKNKDDDNDKQFVQDGNNTPIAHEDENTDTGESGESGDDLYKNANNLSVFL